MKNQNLDFTITTIACAYVCYLAVKNLWKIISGNTVGEQIPVFLCFVALLLVSVVLFFLALRTHLIKSKEAKEQPDVRSGEDGGELRAEADEASKPDDGENGDRSSKK